MPPQISDDESETSEGVAVPIPEKEVKNGKVKGKAAAKYEEEKLAVESEKGEEEDDDNEGDEDADTYIVENILSHTIDDETGEFTFEVKWEGYEKKSERTWEPEENLATAGVVVDTYLAGIGGREAIIEAWQEAKAANAEKKSKKRGRASAGPEKTNGSKRGKKAHPTETSPPASSASRFKPPTGSWEQEVVAIDAAAGEKGKIDVYLTWKNGHKSVHPLNQVYMRCPQKMLKFYEDHLVFKKADE